MDKKRIVLLLVKYQTTTPALLDGVIEIVKSYPQVELVEVTHPEYPEFATITNKDDITAAISSNLFISIDRVMAECKNLKWFHILGAGCDKHVAYEPFRKSSITLTASRGCSAIALSEFTIGAMIYWSRKFRAWDELQKQSKWGTIAATDISKKRITVVGYGSIGSKIGRICKNSFEMTVVGVKNRVEESIYKEHPEVEKFYRLSELGDACDGADFVVCVLPSTKETEDVFTLDVFKRFKKTTVFISIGRGSNVVEEDLIEALKKGYIGGAVLDVFKTEPLPKTSPFYTEADIQDKILITCHRGGNSESIMEDFFNICRSNLEAFIEGRPLDRIVDKEIGY